MKILRFNAFLVAALLLATFASAAGKLHVISFGRWIPVQWLPASDSSPLTMRVRPLLVDGRFKEYVLGPPHEISDSLFVVRRAFRVNDALPDEVMPRWQWQRGGWLLVDRVSGRVSPNNLSAFDPFLAAGSLLYQGAWLAERMIAIDVAVAGRRELLHPVTRAIIAGGEAFSAADIDRDRDRLAELRRQTAPVWQRSPVRVTFTTEARDKQTFAIRGSAVDLVNEGEEDD